MAALSETKTWDRLVSSTFENFDTSGGLQDAIHKGTVLMAFLKEKGRVKTISGGDRIGMSLMYGKNSTIKSQSKQDSIDVTPQDGVTTAFFNWKYLTGSTTIWTPDLMMNKGNKTRIFDIMDGAKEQLIMSVAEEWTTQAVSDGTGNGGLDWLGLQALVADTPTSGTLAGINRANEAWWRNQYNNSVGAFAANGMSKTRNLYNKCSLGTAKGTPDLCLMTQTIHESMENEHLQILRFAKEDEKMADLHFANFKFGTATCVFEEQAPSGSQYMLNSKYLFLVMHEDANFKLLPKRETHNQLAQIFPFLAMGNLASNNCRKLGVNTDIT